MSNLSFSAKLTVTSLLLSLLAGLLFWGCAPKYPAYKIPGKKVPATQQPYRINGKTYYPIYSSEGFREVGVASWYGGDFHGRKTANGETYNMHTKTAAHKTLPMQTMVLVRNLENGKETVVRINDRGPFSKGRIIDLSYAAAADLDMIRNGTARTEVIALGESVGDISPKMKLKHEDFNAGNFYIQIGSFLDKNNALNLASRFTDLGMRISIQPFEKDGRTYHRVQVSAGNSLNFAKQLEQQLVGSGFSESFVVAR